MQNTRSKLGIKNNSNLSQTDITKVSNLDSLDWESKDAAQDTLHIAIVSTLQNTFHRSLVI
jgi:hypothetical protein